MSECALNYENNTTFNKSYTQKLLIAFKTEYFPAFTQGEI